MLATQFQTTAFDLPGFGLSDPTEPIELGQLSERLLRNIVAGAAHAPFLSHSMEIAAHVKEFLPCPTS